MHDDPCICDPRGDLTLIVGPTTADDTDADTADHAEPATVTKTFQVCSRSLSRASPVFDRMLHGHFAEAAPAGGADGWTVHLPSDDASALALLLHIVHGQFAAVPRRLSAGALYRLTVLTHYYDATRALAPWAQEWLAALDRAGGSPAAQLLWIGWELGSAEVFDGAARRMLMQGDGRAFAEGAPLFAVQHPPDIVERIIAIRLQTIASLLDVFRDLIERLLVVDEKPRWCKHASFMGPHRCESMILGSVTFCLTRAGLWPLPAAEHVNDSVFRVYTKLINVVVHDIGRVGGGSSSGDAVSHAACNPKRILEGEVRRIMQEMPDPATKFHRDMLVENAARLAVVERDELVEEEDDPGDCLAL